MPTPFTTKRIYNPEDEDQYVDLNIIDTLILAHGSGSIYQKRFLNFLNHEANNRNVRIRTISHVDQDVEGNPTDTEYSGSIEVEELGEFSLKHGFGSIYQKHIDRLDPNDILWDFRVRDVGGEGRDEALLVFGRKAHRKRINGTDGWIDVERIDELVVLHGSGSIYRKEIIRLNWDDEEFDGTIGLPLADQEQDGFDPPYRLDPFQSIYNVGWGEEGEGLEPVEIPGAIRLTWNDAEPTNAYTIGHITIGAASGTLDSTGSFNKLRNEVLGTFNTENKTGIFLVTEWSNTEFSVQIHISDNGPGGSGEDYGIFAADLSDVIFTSAEFFAGGQTFRVKEIRQEDPTNSARGFTFIWYITWIQILD